MNTDNVRINITLPKELIQVVDAMSGPRKRSLFIAEAIVFKIKQDKKAEIEKKLSEGYRICQKESLDIADDFESVDLEGWDDQY
jgi:metal-responsive CopG/Arc/MetJ family transcriptional regulator